VISTGPEPLKATVAAAAAAAAVGGGARGAKRVTLTFAPGTLGPAGLLLRLTGAVRQTCPLGEKQVTGNPTSDPVPASQCGCASGFEIGTDADGMFHTQRIDATCLALHACQGGFCCSAGEGRWESSEFSVLYMYWVGLSRSERTGYACATELTIGADKKSVTMSAPESAAAGMTLRYLFADWPIPTVYSAASFLGENGELPTPPFTMTIEWAALTRPAERASSLPSREGKRKAGPRTLAESDIRKTQAQSSVVLWRRRMHSWKSAHSLGDGAWRAAAAAAWRAVSSPFAGCSLRGTGSR
jgi:hypothetical protein